MSGIGSLRTLLPAVCGISLVLACGMARNADAATFDFNAAYKAAGNGAVVHVPAGRYGVQEILKDTSKGLSGPAVTFVPDGPVYLDAGLYLGSANGCVQPPPNWITFDGGSNKNFIIGDMQHESWIYACGGDHLTFRNMRIINGMPTEGSPFALRSPSNLLIENNIIGPVCCGTKQDGQAGSSPILLRLTKLQGTANPTNVTIRNNVFEGSARFCSDWNEAGWNTKYGPCPRPTCPDVEQCHNDSIHSYGAENLVIEGNRFPYYDVQAIFMEEVFDGMNVSGRIVNNHFGHDLEDTWHAIWLAMGNHPAGTWDIKFNTLAESNAILVGSWGSPTVNVVGNLGGRLTRGGPGDCQTGNGTYTYRYNIWHDASVPWIDNCDATDAMYPKAAIAGWLNAEGKLSTGASPPNGFVQGSGSCITEDIDGESRPATGCDAGADEFAGGGSPAPPLNTVVPVVSGVAKDGLGLTTSNGTWTGAQPMSFSYQWVRCTTAWVCSNVAGATGQSYTLTPADVGFRLLVWVTATNSGGQATAKSPASAVVVAAPPASTSLPALSGVAKAGATLATSIGTWAGTSPFTFTYQWIRCTTTWVCTNIAGATSSSYTLTDADVAFRIQAAVTAANAAAQTTVRSFASAVIAAAAPANVTLPVLSGVAKKGQALTSSNGTWSGTQPITFSYQWVRCTTTWICTNIPGATNASYTLATADVGFRLYANATAANAGGQATAHAWASAVVLP